MTASESRETELIIRPLQRADLPAADKVMRVAFGTFLGMEDPAAFMGDANYIENRWRADPRSAFAAELDGEIVGSNLAAHWGSFAFFGPLTVRPDVWNLGIGRALMQPILQLFDEWGVQLAGLFTFADSPRHLGMYRKFGFAPRYLTALMSRPVEPVDAGVRWERWSELSASDRETAAAACRRVTGAIFEGLDVRSEIEAIDSLALGDTLLLWEAAELAAFAACHVGPGTEAGGGRCYVKFAAVRPGREAARIFEQLLAVCLNFAASRGVARLVAGVNTARSEAYAVLSEQGFRTRGLGVAMHRPNQPGFSRPGVFVLDDWR